MGASLYLCGPTMYVAKEFSGHFFLLCFTVACYTLSRKEKGNYNLIHGAFGSTWGHNFYMDMQNGSKLEI